MTDPSTWSFDTRQIHAGQAPDPTTGSRALPIHATTSYAFKDTEHAALLAARTHGHDSALAFLDIDGLKQVNDADGHDVGDKLITDVAGVLRDTMGRSDIVARLGGDEFAIVAADQPAAPTPERLGAIDRLSGHLPPPLVR